MRQVLLGLVGTMAASAAYAETYSFLTWMSSETKEQTLIHCTGPKTNGREPVPTGCVLSEPAIAYPNQLKRGHFTGIACAAGHPIEFYPNGTLAECMLAAEQPEPVSGFTAAFPLGSCRGLVRFDKDGRAEC